MFRSLNKYVKCTYYAPKTILQKYKYKHKHTTMWFHVSLINELNCFQKISYLNANSNSILITN